jgi:hypothetical protein
MNGFCVVLLTVLILGVAADHKESWLGIGSWSTFAADSGYRKQFLWCCATPHLLLVLVTLQ